jgi:polysaccharide export outer membrane protein
MTRRRLCPLLAWLAAGAACSHTQPYVWADDLPATMVEGAPTVYAIQPGDLVSIRVWNQDNMSTRVRVRDDGKISVPFLNDVQAANKLSTALAHEIEIGLKPYLNNPIVTVTIEEVRPLTVSVLGEVAKPGSFAVGNGAGVLQALAAAGGLTEFANRDGIFVIRQGNPPNRIRFTLSQLTQATGRAGAFRLKHDDVVYVE